MGSTEPTEMIRSDVAVDARADERRPLAMIGRQRWPSSARTSLLLRGRLRHDVPLPAAVDGEQALRALAAPGGVLLLPGEREERSRRQAVVLAVNLETQRSRQHRDVVVGGVVVLRRREAGHELDEEVAGALGG